MGEARQTGRLSDAAGRRAAGRLAARPALRAFLRDRSGATAIEYSLICGLIFLAIVTSVTAFGDKSSEMFDRISETVSSTM